MPLVHSTLVDSHLFAIGDVRTYQQLIIDCDLAFTFDFDLFVGTQNGLTLQEDFLALVILRNANSGLAHRLLDELWRLVSEAFS